MPVESDKLQDKDVMRTTCTRHDSTHCSQINGHNLATRTGAKHADDTQTGAADIVIMVPDGMDSFLRIMSDHLLHK